MSATSSPRAFNSSMPHLPFCATYLTLPSWVPIENDDPTICGRPQTYDASSEWAGKKVIIVSVPGAFTPGCQANHLPPYIKNMSALKAKGVDKVAVIAYNDAWVMNAWAKVNKVSGDDLVSFGEHNGQGNAD